MAEVCIQTDATQPLQMHVLPPCITPLLSVSSPEDQLEVCVSCCARVACPAHRLCRAVSQGVTPALAARHGSQARSTRRFTGHPATSWRCSGPSTGYQNISARYDSQGQSLGVQKGMHPGEVQIYGSIKLMNVQQKPSHQIPGT